MATWTTQDVLKLNKAQHKKTLKENSTDKLATSISGLEPYRKYMAFVEKQNKKYTFSDS
jgi:hypothetical protein